MTSRTFALIGVLSIPAVSPAAYAGSVTGVTVSQRSIATGGTVSVTVTGTNPCGAAHIVYGDGDAITYAITGLPVTQTHVYQKAGSYTIAARGMGNCDGEATTTLTVSDPPAPPRPAAPPGPAPSISAVEIAPTPAKVNEPVAVVTRGTGTCAYEVCYGDGTAEQIDAQLPEDTHHTYAKPGRYVVIVRPAAPCVGRFTLPLQVVEGPVPARITHVVASSMPAIAGESITIAVHGTGACAYDVSYGDGSTQQVDGPLPQETRHVYPRAGSYTVVVRSHPPCTSRITEQVQVVADTRPPRITRLSVAPTPATAGRPVTITVEGTGTCLFKIDYGDGDWGSRSMALPATLRHEYAAAGVYTVAASSGDSSCTGSDRVRLEVRP
jgi:hypothetical protein